MMVESSHRHGDLEFVMMKLDNDTLREFVKRWRGSAAYGGPSECFVVRVANEFEVTPEMVSDGMSLFFKNRVAMTGDERLLLQPIGFGLALTHWSYVLPSSVPAMVEVHPRQRVKIGVGVPLFMVSFIIDDHDVTLTEVE